MRRKNNLFLLLILLLLGIGLGYALLSQDLTVNGTTKVKGNNWSIYFDNIQVTTGSVSLSEGDQDADLAENSDTVVEYTITLNQPGDFYEFTVDAVNDGTVDAMIGEIISKLNNTVISTTNPVPSYLDYSVTYEDGIPIAVNHLLAANSTETYKVRVEFKRDIENSELPTTDQTNSFSFGVSYVQSDSNAVPVYHPVDFSTDSWETVIGAIKSGNTSAYHVGDTKTVELGNSLGTHILRIANTSTPAECSTTGFSQTACGFVLEFADIITTHNMNPAGEYKGVQYDNGWNVDGWPVSSMYAYLNDENDSTSIINSLPEVLRNAIIDTTVVSGHGRTSGETNFTSTDKLYLLSTHEVWEDVDGNTSSGLDYYDTAYNNTRQLDYYANLGITMGAYNNSTSSYDGNYSGAIKKYNGSSPQWWLRSANSITITTDNFYDVFTDGGRNWNPANLTLGVSPAFRIA